MVANNSNEDDLELTKDGDGNDGFENQSPDASDGGTGEDNLGDDLNKSEDESSSEIAGDIAGERLDDKLKGDPGEDPGEGFDEDLTGDPGEDLDLDGLDLGDLDFEDDDANENPSGGKKKKVILVGGSTVLILVLIALGALFFLWEDGKPEMGVKAEDAKPGSLMMIPPKRRMRMGQKLGGKARAKTPAWKTGKAALQAPSAGPSTPTSPPKLSRTPEAGSAPGPSKQSRPAGNAKAASVPTNQATGKPPASQVAVARIVPGAGLTVPATTADAYSGIPPQPKAEPLAAPRRDMMETVDGRVLPKLGPKREPSWQTYAHPFEAKPRKVRVSLIIRGLGLSRNSTLAAISRLPAAVSLAFSPYTRGLEQWSGMARGAGHETLLSLPMEPMEFPASDPGPLAMMTDLESQENITRLRQIMGLSKAFVGLVQNMGSRFMTSSAALQPILAQLNKHGLVFVDDGLIKDSLGTSLANTLRLPNARADLIIDEDATGQQIRANLRELELIAKNKKVAVGIGEAYPATVLQISRWAKTLPDKNIQLAPISGVISVPASPKPEKPQ